MRRGKIGLALVVLLGMSVVASAQLLTVSLATDPDPVVAGIDSFFDVYVNVGLAGSVYGVESIDLSIVSVEPAASARAVEVIVDFPPPPHGNGMAVWEWNLAEMGGYIQIDPTWTDIGPDGDVDAKNAAAAAKALSNTNFTLGTDDGLGGTCDMDLIGIAGWICEGPPITHLDVIVNKVYVYTSPSSDYVVQLTPGQIETLGVEVNIPEPATLLLLGLSGLFLRRRK